MNSTLARRILLPFVAVTIVVLAVLLTFDILARHVEAAHESERRLLALQVQLREITAKVHGGILTSQERFAIQAANAALAADKQLQALAGLHGDQGGHGELARNFENYYAGMVALNSLFLEKRIDEGTSQLAKLQLLQGHIDNRVGKLREAARDERERLAELAFIAEVLSVLAMFGALLLMAAMLMRRVVAPMRSMAHAMKEVAGKAERDMEQQKILLSAKDVPQAASVPPVHDELGSLEHSFRRMLELLTHERESLRLAASVFSSSHEGILISDPDGNIIDVNEAFCAITGYPREELIGVNPRLLKSDRHDQAFYQALWQELIDPGSWSGEIWNRRKDGHVYPELLTINAVRNAAGEIAHYVAVATDISLIKTHEKELEYIAHFDALTGIPNRVLLSDRMALAIAQTRRERCQLAVGYLDLDEFKPINDQYGHAAGDKLLIEITGRLKALLRGSDTIARLSGDEFVFLLLGLDSPAQCMATLDRILEAIARPIDLGDHQVTVSASIGVTLFPDDDTDPDTLLRHADQAMYQAKQAGRNCFHFYDAGRAFTTS